MILLTGATGRIGGFFLKDLISNEEDVRVLVRKGNKTRLNTIYQESNGGKSSGKIEIFYGDLKDKKVLKEAVRDVKKIIHLGACTNPLARKEEFFSVNVNGTRNLIEASLNEDIEKFIYSSSVSVMGNDIKKKPPADETYFCKPAGSYGLSKLEGEKVCLKYHKNENFPVTILRFSWVYGPYSNSGVDWILSFITKKYLPVIPIPGDGKNLVHLVHIKDVVHAVNAAIEKRGTKNGEIYIIAGRKPCTVEEFFDTCINVTNLKGNNKPRIHIPPVFVSTLATIEESKKLLGFRPSFTRTQGNNFLNNRAFDIEKAKKELSYEPKISLEEGIKDVALWMGLV